MVFFAAETVQSVLLIAVLAVLFFLHFGTASSGLQSAGIGIIVAAVSLEWILTLSNMFFMWVLPLI